MTEICFYLCTHVTEELVLLLLLLLLLLLPPVTVTLMMFVDYNYRIHKGVQPVFYDWPWHVLSCMWDDAYKRTLAATRKE